MIFVFYNILFLLIIYRSVFVLYIFVTKSLQFLFLNLYALCANIITVSLLTDLWVYTVQIDTGSYRLRQESRRTDRSPRSWLIADRLGSVVFYKAAFLYFFLKSYKKAVLNISLILPGGHYVTNHIQSTQ